MVDYQAENLLSSACEQMGALIVKLLRECDAADDASAEQAYSCLREFRRKSVMHDECERFNATLQALKAEFATAAAGIKGAEVWSALLQDGELKGGLITAAETEESDVDLPSAADFWSPPAHQPPTAAAVAQSQNDDDDEAFLDDLE